MPEPSIQNPHLYEGPSFQGVTFLLASISTPTTQKGTANEHLLAIGSQMDGGNNTAYISGTWAPASDPSSTKSVTGSIIDDRGLCVACSWMNGKIGPISGKQGMNTLSGSLDYENFNWLLQGTVTVLDGDGVPQPGGPGNVSGSPIRSRPSEVYHG
jgi:hypothetical protein